MKDILPSHAFWLPKHGAASDGQMRAVRGFVLLALNR